VALFVARPLGRLGPDPIVVDARQVRLKAHRPIQKTAGRNTLERCEGLRRGFYRSIVHVPREEVSRLRDTLSRCRHFARLQAAQVGAVKALLYAAGLGRLSRSLGSEAGWARVIAASNFIQS
jgi:transposase